MLIISRKAHQEIVIGDDIVLTVVAVRGKQVRLGIQAPRDVHVRRQELAPLEQADVQTAELVLQD